jgi:beta-glucosidase
VPQSRLDDMVHRIVRSMFANGVVDDPPQRSVVDPFTGRDDAQKIEEESIVLLQNTGGILPISPQPTHRIAVIGANSDFGVISGGGSAQVDAPGGRPGGSKWGVPVYFPSSPLRYLKENAGPDVTFAFDNGANHAQAAKVAAAADVAIIFADQWMSEGQDAATLSLPKRQDALIEAVAAANPNTIVVLETGGPVSMPWSAKVKGIVEAWYPGIGGGQAIANILMGRVNPSGKLPVTFAAKDADLPHPQVTGLTPSTENNRMDASGGHQRNFTVDYNVEGMMTGYRWFQAKDKQPLFPFGFGLSYTQFAYSNMQIDPTTSTVTFTLHNTGNRPSDEIAEVYVTLPSAAGEPFRKLAGWKRVPLAVGASEIVSIPLDPLYLKVFSADDDAWHRTPGDFTFEVGGSSTSLPLHSTIRLGAQ